MGIFTFGDRLSTCSLPQTHWHSDYGELDAKPPHWLIIDTRKSRTIRAFSYLPRSEGPANGIPAELRLEFSDDGQAWRDALNASVARDTKGEWLTTFTPRTARYFRFTILSERNGNAWGSAAELNLWTTDPGR